jgi:hypothetical protein
VQEEEPEHADQTSTPEGPSKDPQSADVDAGKDPTEADGRTEGMQSSVVHEGAPADDRPDTNELADKKANIVEPDGEPPSPRA